MEEMSAWTPLEEIALHKTDDKGRIWLWRALVQHNEKENEARTTFTWGLQNGKHKSKSVLFTETTKSKRSTPGKAALSAAKSKARVKRREGYLSALDEGASRESPPCPLPMLAFSLDKRPVRAKPMGDSVFI